jgi:hypothetical protein
MIHTITHWHASIWCPGRRSTAGNGQIRRDFRAFPLEYTGKCWNVEAVFKTGTCRNFSITSVLYPAGNEVERCGENPTTSNLETSSWKVLDTDWSRTYTGSGSGILISVKGVQQETGRLGKFPADLSSWIPHRFRPSTTVKNVHTDLMNFKRVPTTGSVRLSSHLFRLHSHAFPRPKLFLWIWC